MLTDLSGKLEPCGCTSRPLGGIDRLAGQLRALREEAPSLLLLAGDTLFGAGAGQAEGAETQERWQAEALVEILGDLEADAIAPGARDLGLGLRAFEQITTRASFPWLAAGVRPDPERRGGLGRLLLLERGGLRIGIVGVSALEDEAGALPEGLRREIPPLEAARTGAAELRRSGAELVIALGHGDRRLGRGLSALEGVDFAILGGLDRSEAMPPIEGDPGWILHAGRQGQGLLVVDLYRVGAGPYADQSEWGRALERAQLEAEADELRDRIAEWAREGRTAEADLETQRSRLVRMREQAEALESPAPWPEGNAFEARMIEIAPEMEPDAAIRARLDAHFRRINEHNRSALAEQRPPPLPEGAAGYVGDLRCAECHAPAHQWWQQTPHGRAYATLVERDRQYDLDCVGCHVTGYRRPGGSTAVHNEGLVNVGCEVCHGPGSLHLDDPEGHALELEFQERLCRRCHSEEHSDRFEFETYRAMLRAPGHGLPPESP